MIKGFKRPKAYVFDIDGTLLSGKQNPFEIAKQAGLVNSATVGKYVGEFGRWTAEAKSIGTVPVGMDLYRRAQAEGAKIFLLTARNPKHEGVLAGTVRQLQAAGISTDNLLFAPTTGEEGAYKDWFRKQISKDYRVTNVGDSISDFTGGHSARNIRIVGENRVIDNYRPPAIQRARQLKLPFPEQLRLPFGRTTGSHKPLIEGLRHGGWAAKLRRALTAFGSGWRGFQRTDTPRWLHGTTRTFDRFDLGKRATGDAAIYLTSRPSEAQVYARQSRDGLPAVGGNVRPVEIRSDRVLEVAPDVRIPLRLRLKNQGSVPKLPATASSMDLYHALARAGGDPEVKLGRMLRRADYDALVVPVAGGHVAAVFNPEVLHPVFGRRVTAIDKSIIRHLAGKHEPLIEGLKHGGLAEGLRKILTHFGSGWRGLIEGFLTHGMSALPSSVVKRFGGAGAGALASKSGAADERIYSFLFSRTKPLTESSFNRIVGLARKGNSALLPRLEEAGALDAIREMQASKTSFADFKQAYGTFRATNRWSQQTGFNPIFWDAKLFGNKPPDVMKYHELIHSTENANYSHPFIAKARQESRPLEELLRKPEAYRGLPPRLLQSEQLAYTYQGDPRFLQRAEEAGVLTPKVANDLVGQALLKTSRKKVNVQVGKRYIRQVMRAARTRAAAGMVRQASPHVMHGML